MAKTILASILQQDYEAGGINHLRRNKGKMLYPQIFSIGQVSPEHYVATFLKGRSCHEAFSWTRIQ